jgi:hypothetical protein
MTPFFDDWKHFCFVLREIAAGTGGHPLSGVEARTRARRVLAEAGYRWSGYTWSRYMPDSELLAAFRDLEKYHSDVYWQVVQRTFAELYGVPIDSVDIIRNAESTTVRCAGKIFTRHDNDVRRFTNGDEDPVTIMLSAEKQAHLEGRT